MPRAIRSPRTRQPGGMSGDFEALYSAHRPPWDPQLRQKLIIGASAARPCYSIRAERQLMEQLVVQRCSILLVRLGAHRATSSRRCSRTNRDRAAGGTCGVDAFWQAVQDRTTGSDAASRPGSTFPLRPSRRGHRSRAPSGRYQSPRQGSLRTGFPCAHGRTLTHAVDACGTAGSTARVAASRSRSAMR